MNATPFTRATLAAALALALAACDRDTSAQARNDAAAAGQKIERALEHTGEKIAEASRKAAAEVKETASEVKSQASTASNEVKSGDAGRSLSDAAITASIKTDYLKDPDLSVLKIDVDTKDGVVTLNGMANTADGKQRAEKLAGAIKGVKEVRNHLTVKQG
jgi:hyperosmotically inducible periplasmic protein